MILMLLDGLFGLNIDISILIIQIVFAITAYLSIVIHGNILKLLNKITIVVSIIGIIILQINIWTSKYGYNEMDIYINLYIVISLGFLIINSLLIMLGSDSITIHKKGLILFVLGIIGIFIEFYPLII